MTDDCFGCLVLSVMSTFSICLMSVVIEPCTGEANQEWEMVAVDVCYRLQNATWNCCTTGTFDCISCNPMNLINFDLLDKEMYNVI
jgi:hypothetical protein